MIYTSYFANMRKFPKDTIPISICVKAPSWYKGIEYKKLAPSYSILMDYKNDYDKEKYIMRFNEEVLSKLNQDSVVKDLLLLAGNFKGVGYFPDIVLLCYEKSTDFCHRHLVADWLNNRISEYRVEELK